MSYAQERSTFRATSGFMLALAVQAGMLLALKSGLLPHFISAAPPVTEVVPLVSNPQTPPDERVTGGTMDSFDVVAREPVIDIDIEDDFQAQQPVWQPMPGADESGGYPGAQPRMTAPRVDPRYPLTQPEYPPSSIRQGEVGTVTLLIYVLPNGRVADAKVSRSSGFTRLDAAAVREAKRSWRFMPATSDGTPVADWGTYAVTFRLTN